MSKQPTIQTDILALVVPEAPEAPAASETSEPNDPKDGDELVPPTGYGLAMMELLRLQSQPEGEQGEASATRPS